MELLILIFFVWLIGAIFPGSGDSYGPDLGDVAGFIVCALFLVFLFFAYGGLVAGILMTGTWLGIDGSEPLGGAWLLFALLGPLAIPMIVASVVNGPRDRAKVSA